MQYFTWGPTVEESSSNAFLAIFFKIPFSPMIVSLTICPFGNIVIIILAPSTASSAEEHGVAPNKKKYYNAECTFDGLSVKKHAILTIFSLL